jgi:hypothetical protein
MICSKQWQNTSGRNGDEKMDTEERNEIIEDIENILILHGIAPGSIDFEKWTDEELDGFEIEEFMKNRR